MKKIVIFGAGNIGRSFIAPVFSRAGYEVVFADVSPAVLAALEEKGAYTLVDKSDGREDRVSRIHPVRGVDAKNAESVKIELESADICATCVGAAALPAVLTTIAASVRDRERPLDIILAENLKDAAELTRKTFEKAGIDKRRIDEKLGIIETSIGKMVPLMPPEVSASDPLLSWAEPFNTLIVDRDGFRAGVPNIPDLMPVSPIAPWVARKLFIHNFGHAATAYIAYEKYPREKYIWQALSHQEVSTAVRAAMSVSGQALRAEYPGIFTADEIQDHIDDLLARFENRALGDTIYRVGRDLARKLKRNDRVVGVIAMILKHGLDAGPALEVFRAALGFRAPGPDGDADSSDLAVLEARKHPESFIKDVVGIDIDKEAATEKNLAARLLTALEKAK